MTLISISHSCDFNPFDLGERKVWKVFWKLLQELKEVEYSNGHKICTANLYYNGFLHGCTKVEQNHPVYSKIHPGKASRKTISVEEAKVYKKVVKEFFEKERIVHCVDAALILLQDGQFYKTASDKAFAKACEN